MRIKSVYIYEATSTTKYQRIRIMGQGIKKASFDIKEQFKDRLCATAAMTDGIRWWRAPPWLASALIQWALMRVRAAPMGTTAEGRLVVAREVFSS